MSVTQRAVRLRIDIRLAILENIVTLSRQLNTALEKNNLDEVKRIQTNINKLHDQLDELSKFSLDSLEESDEVKKTIKKLRKSADDLEEEADKISDLTSALKKGARIVQKAAKIIAALKGLVTAL